MIPKLKEARKEAGHTIDYVAKKLNIRKQYLLALEEENEDMIPGKVYVQGYKKIYYNLLGINFKDTNEDSNSTRALNLLNKTIKSSVFIKKCMKYVIFSSIIFLAVVAVMQVSK